MWQFDKEDVVSDGFSCVHLVLCQLKTYDDTKRACDSEGSNILLNI